MTQSKELTEFYQAYKKWLEEGAPAERPFFRYWGLCSNFTAWAHDYGAMNRQTIFTVGRELTQQFADAGLDIFMPFNAMKGGDNYTEEAASHQTHLNPKRIQWVKEHANP